MAGMKQNVVGRGNNSVSSAQPTPTPTPTRVASAPTAGAVGTDLSNRIDALIKNSNIPLATFVSSNADAGIVGNLSAQELKSVALVLKSMGYNVKSLEDARTTLISGDFPEATTQPNYNALVSYLRSQEIPDLTGPSMPTQTVTQYSDDYLKKVADGIGQSFLDRKLTTEEVDKIMPKLKELVNKGTTTTTKKVGGKNVVTTTPGFTTADAEKVVQTELRLGASEDLQRKQYIDFADFMSKNMAGM